MSKLLNRKSLGGSYDFRLDDGFCVANCGIGKDWCTVYLLETHPEHRGKGEAQKLLKFLQEKCKQTNRKFRVWYPMNDKVEHICSKLGIEVIRDIDREEVAGRD